MASGVQQLEALDRKLEEARKKADAIARQKAALAAKLRARDTVKRRKEETRRKIEGGGLLHIAGLLGEDPGLVLGGLLELSKALEAHPERALAWKANGDAALEKRASQRASSVSRTTPTR